MKRIVLSLSLLLCMPAFAETVFKSVADAETKLTNYTVADIDDDKQRLAEGKELKINEIFDDLQAISALMAKEKMTEELALQIERACLLASLHDPSNYAIDIILPIYQKNKAVFEKAAQRLHPYDRKNLLDALKGKDDEAKNGNG
jgi:hypothetical protein